MELFLDHTLLRHHIFYFLFNFKIFIFCQKTSYLKWKKRVRETIPFDTHFTANLPPLTILKKKSSFLKETSNFSKI